MSRSFQDHFSTASQAYALYRPRYPEVLFDVLVEMAPSRDLALDCATGSGQVARALARRFQRVVATDASAAQIAAATPVPGVEYRVELAERCSLPEHSVALVAVGQALHWLDRPAFYAEVRRVCRPGGVVAAFGYGLGALELPAHRLEANGALRRFCNETLGPYWPPERAHVDAGYTTLEFPFEPIRTPRFALHNVWTLDDLCGYVGTWSATKRYREARRRDPLPELRAELERWWTTRTAHVFRAPLYLLAGRV